MLLVTGGGLGTYVPLVGRPLRRFFLLLGHGSFHFVPCIPPFLGALVYFLLARFHQKTTLAESFENFHTNLVLVFDQRLIFLFV